MVVKTERNMVLAVQIEEKENSLKDAQNQLNLKQKDYSDFKQKVDEQKAKTESLLQQYLQALPK